MIEIVTKITFKHAFIVYLEVILKSVFNIFNILMIKIFKY